MSYGVGCRRGLDLTLLWLWHRPAVIAPIRPVAWELLYAMGGALKRQKSIKKKKKELQSLSSFEVSKFVKNISVKYW